MEKLSGGDFLPQVEEGEKDAGRERERVLGGTVLDVVEIEKADKKIEQNAQREFQETVEEIAQTDVVVYERLNPSNLVVAREAFLADPTLVKPPFEFGNIDPDKVEVDLETLEQVEEKVATGEFSDKQRRLLGLALTDNHLKNEILRAANQYNTARDRRTKDLAKREFAKCNVELFGAPDEATFESILQEKFKEIPVEILSVEDKKLYDDLKSRLEIGEGKTVERFRPRAETVRQFGDLIEMLYANLFRHIPEDQQEFTPEETERIVQEILDEEFDGRTKIKAELVPDATSLSFDQVNKKIKIPGKPVGGKYSRKKLRSVVIGHELGTHAYRSLVHEDNPISMFHIEAPGNSDFDEGLAVCVEQALNGKVGQVRGAYHYINIGLATFRGMNFREVFEAQKDLKYLLAAKSDETVEETLAREEKAEKGAFNEAMRCFRGTGELPNNKDLIYYNGSNRVWQYIEEHIDAPEELLRSLFLTGKTNQLNKDQERLAYETQVGGLI